MNSKQLLDLLRMEAKKLEASTPRNYSDRAMTSRDVGSAIAEAFEGLASTIAFEEGARMKKEGEALKEEE